MSFKSLYYYKLLFHISLHSTLSTLYGSGRDRSATGDITYVTLKYVSYLTQKVFMTKHEGFHVFQPCPHNEIFIFDKRSSQCHQPLFFVLSLLEPLLIMRRLGQQDNTSPLFMLDQKEVVFQIHS